QAVAAISRLVKSEGGEDALLHVDAVQMAGRKRLDFVAINADYMSLSAHKLGGPQGSGALIVKDDAPLSAQIAGGGQEMRRRSGTENVAAIAGFGAAAAELADFADGMASLLVLRDRFEAELAQAVPELIIFGAGAERLANTSNFA